MIQPQPLTNLDFADIKSALIFYLKYNTKFTDYDYAGSNLNSLLDVLSYNTFINSYNINFAVNEMSLQTATIRDNVTSIAQSLGYTPKNYSSSVISANIEISGLSGADFCVIEPGGVFSSNNTDIVYKFGAVNNITAKVDNSGNCVFTNIQLKEGELFFINYIVDTTDEDQRFIIPNDYVDINSIVVTVNSEVYKNSNSIITDSVDDYLFYTNYVQDGQLEILFGDNIFGKAPSTGDIIIITYLVNNGSDANGISNFTYTGVIKAYYQNVTNGVSVDITNIKYNTSISDFGTDLESLASIKFFAPRMYAAQNRSLNKNDYEVAVKNIYPNTKKITAIGGECLSPPQYGTLKLILQTIDGRLSTTQVKNYIVQQLKKNNVVSISPFIVDAKYVTLKIKPYIVYDLRKLPIDVDTLRNKINTLINNFVNETTETEFFGNRLQSQIYNLDKSIISVKIKLILKGTINHISNSTKYYESFGTNLYTKNCNSVQFISSPFSISNNRNSVRLISYSNTNKISLQQYSVTDNTPMWNTLVDTVGQVDSDTGVYQYAVPALNDTISILSIPDNIDIITTDNIVLVPEINSPYITTDIQDPIFISDVNLLSEPEINIGSILQTTNILDISTTTIEDIIPTNGNSFC